MNADDTFEARAVMEATVELHLDAFLDNLIDSAIHGGLDLAEFNHWIAADYSEDLGVWFGDRLIERGL